ncbi:MAG: cbb3-type cytochrome oxidase assembly protein CcoS [Pseudobdellovibrionaceae bacterium]
MDVLIYLIPLALLIGFIWFIAFVWSLKHGQFEDLDGAARRILLDDDDINDTGAKNKPHSSKAQTPD